MNKPKPKNEMCIYCDLNNFTN